MKVELNHTIVAGTDKRASAGFVAGILGIEVAAPWGSVPAGGAEQRHHGPDGHLLEVVTQPYGPTPGSPE